jgi:membrane protein DedA with SNARE-associated domain
MRAFRRWRRKRCGAVPIRPDRFLLYAAAGALLWAGTWIILGYLCAEIIGLMDQIPQPVRGKSLLGVTDEGVRV